MTTKRRKRRPVGQPRYQDADKEAALHRQLAAEVEHQGRVVKAMGWKPESRRGKGARFVQLGWQWPGPRTEKTFREELAAAKLVRKVMGQPAWGMDVLNRRAQTAAERATGEWVPTFQFSFRAPTRSALEDLERRAQQLTGVWVRVVDATRGTSKFRDVV